MIAIDPIPITGSILTSSNIQESVVSEYNPATTYVIGERRGVTTGTAQVIYDSLQNGNAGHTPASSPTWWKVIGTVYADFVLASTYALGDIVTGIGSDAHTLFRSLASSNTLHPLSDTTKWQPIGATNRFKMFDAINNSQSENPDAIIFAVSPALIANGFYIGEVDGDNWSLTVTDAVEGIVYTETQSLVMSNSGSSFFNWYFKRIIKKTWAVSLSLPMYANAVVTVAIYKPGGIAKCGMFCVGPVNDFGITLSGLSAGIKDFSTTLFNVDGTSKTIERGYSKNMSLDVIIDNDLIDSTQEQLAAYKQKNLVWIGSKLRGLSIIYGKCASFKTVIEGFLKSRVSIQIEGTI